MCTIFGKILNRNLIVFAHKIVRSLALSIDESELCVIEKKIPIQMTNERNFMQTNIGKNHKNKYACWYYVFDKWPNTQLLAIQ